MNRPLASKHTGALAVVWSWMSALALLTGSPAAADEIGDAFKKGKVSVDWRTRFEMVDDDGFSKDATALTTRLRLGYQTGDWHDFFVFGEMEHNQSLGGEQYNSTANGKTLFPVVADPEDTELNQALIGYTGISNTVLKLGRQRIVLDNHRFIGNVGWRQLEQTFDGFTAASDVTEDIHVVYAYINNVNRVFGEGNPNLTLPAVPDLNTEAHVARGAFDIPFGTLVGYAHFIEIETVPALSHRNLGVRFTGKTPLTDRVELLYTGEFTDQADYKSGASTIDEDYQLAEIGVTVDKLTVSLGHELLGGNGVSAFQTPLATLHAFNGWADKFLVTPAAGLADFYVHVSGTVLGITLLGVYHDFSADQGSADYGTEIDLSASKNFGKLYTVGVKYASYDSDGFSVDTDKLWAWAQLKF